MLLGITYLQGWLSGSGSGRLQCIEAGAEPECCCHRIAAVEGSLLQPFIGIVAQFCPVTSNAISRASSINLQ